eukprot:SAG11_NODE_54_length_19571_cov_29.437786_3_plen_115_part_00
MGGLEPPKLLLLFHLISSVFTPITRMDPVPGFAARCRTRVRNFFVTRVRGTVENLHHSIFVLFGIGVVISPGVICIPPVLASYSVSYTVLPWFISPTCFYTCFYIYMYNYSAFI